jgi:sortase A
VIVQGTGRGRPARGTGALREHAAARGAGTVALAGHRTTFLAPFRDIDELKPSDPIHVQMPYGDFTYSVQRTRIVDPSATWVMRKIGYDRLVLTACHPLYSAAQRIVVTARLVKVTPRGRASQLISTGQT